MESDRHTPIAPCCGREVDYCECPKHIRDRAMIKALAEREEREC